MRNARSFDTRERASLSPCSTSTSPGRRRTRDSSCLSTDHPSGRIIKFPNSKVLESTVYNYSWPLFPFIWNEIKFSIAYESDLELVARTMQEVAEEEMGELMAQRVKVFKGLLVQTPG
jgi:small-conductance mechanosensitive channel